MLLQFGEADTQTASTVEQSAVEPRLHDSRDAGRPTIDRDSGSPD